MALGGGNFTDQNKVMPGAYINFISASRASPAMSERGAATIPVDIGWGPLGEVLELSAESFERDSLKILGYEYGAPELKGLRDLFLNARLAYIYRLGTGGVKASNQYATALYPGKRGDDLKVAVSVNPDDDTKKDVLLYLGAALVDRQTVGSAKGLAPNRFVTWDTGSDLDENAGAPLGGGEDPTLTNAGYQAYLDAVEPYTFNAMGCPSSDPAVKKLFAAFTRRMRDDVGAKFQCVLFNPDENSNYEGVVDVFNPAAGAGESEWGMAYWATGAIAGTGVNASATNKRYDGEYLPDTAHTQIQLTGAIKGGKFAFHRVGGAIRVLSDINSLTDATPLKGEDFKQNQTIRVLDQAANDIAVLFGTRYIGVIPNDADGRVSLWSDIVGLFGRLLAIRAIENFDSGDVEVAPGANKRAVIVNSKVTPVNAMEQLYMAVTVN